MTKEQLKQHIKNQGKRTIFITPNTIFRWWNVFNGVLFNSELPYPDKIVALNPKLKTAGWVIYDPAKRKNKLELGLCLDEVPTRRWFYTILVHEMAHVYTDMHYPNLKAHHGPHFMEWKDAVNELGLPFEKQHAVEDFIDFIEIECEV